MSRGDYCNSIRMDRVEMIGAEHSPGVETTTGSLRQALSGRWDCVGAKVKRERSRVCFHTDGELQEGQTKAFQRCVTIP
jgi:transketolase N-terminal domain/subunit